jgi:tRNA/tmRNA/rRNA uracil-C5-methylase (TrmA/RlmC/RlmD family)
MPGVVPPAQDGHRPGEQPPKADRAVRRRPGAVGAVAHLTAAASSQFTVGQDVEVAIEDVAQGGWCVARPQGLPVMFVRHALPGERVVARVTEVTSKFARADAVNVLESSPDRVDAPCPHARPGGCGGCDWQHASLRAQRALKATVISQQLKRLAGIDRQVTVEALPGDEPASGTPASEMPASETTVTGGTPGLGWRTRVQFAVDRDGVAGLRGHRSHRVTDVGDCLIAHRAVRDLDIPGDDWSGATMVEVAVGGADSTENFAVTVIEAGGQPHGGKRNARGRRNDDRPGGRPARPRRTVVEGRPYLAERAAGRLWQVSADGFWQVHPAAADTLGEAVVAALEPKPGDAVLDLYCGAGLFAGVLAPFVGPGGAVIGVESDAAAVRNARHNLGDFPQVRFLKADVARVASAGDLPAARLVVADPPRAGLAREVVDYLVGDGPAGTGATGNGPAERFAYVSCDPATLARDLALLTAGGWQLDTLRAFDAFPMTHHVECVATLTRAACPSRGSTART